MASSINASTTGVGGIVNYGDTSGDLNIQSGGVTKIAVTSAGVAVTGLSKASLPTGSVLQVVNATYGLASSTSASWVSTGLTASITPTSATSKIAVFAYANCAENGNGAGQDLDGGFRLVRNSTAIIDNGATSFRLKNLTWTTSARFQMNQSFTVLDSPTTTSATSYTLQFYYSGTNANIAADVQNIILMEIAA